MQSFSSSCHDVIVEQKSSEVLTLSDQCSQLQSLWDQPPETGLRHCGFSAEPGLHYSTQYTSSPCICVIVTNPFHTTILVTVGGNKSQDLKSWLSVPKVNIYAPVVSSEWGYLYWLSTTKGSVIFVHGNRKDCDCFPVWIFLACCWSALWNRITQDRCLALLLQATQSQTPPVLSYFWQR